jgi:hypothetical protein
MTNVPWLRTAAPFRDQQVRRLMAMPYAELRSLLGAAPLDVPKSLEGMECRAILRVVEKARRMLEVTVAIVGPDKRSVTTDGFTITPTGKKKSMFDDGYED